uniref:NADH dehydrogenase subunit 6 n=1 Tax=Stenamma megamanni TaxID=1504014 RepID=UPI001FCD04C1|nr:NADH dehydrogenase subunit 6 [Stenamma megamanni]UNZ99571.1 NADH dehydrogenase subunit 6 [Stenamma megamanni]
MTKPLIFYFLSLLLLMFILYTLIYAPLHPMFMILLLILYTSIICTIMSMWTFNYIYSIIVFLMMISGMLIIFLYFSSLISNEQNKPRLTFPMLLNYLLNTIIFTFLLFSSPSLNFFNLTNPNMHMESLTLPLTNTPTFTNTFMIYSHPFTNITILSILFLLLTLFIIIKLCNLKTMPLRKIK